MIRLDKDIVVGKKEEQKSVQKIDMKEMELFANKILNKMKRDKIAPTPYNFQIYFESLLDGSKDDFKQKMNTLRQSEASADNEEHHMQMEKDIKEGFSVVKTMVQSIGSVYKNVTLIKSVIKKRSNELNSTSNQLAMISVLTTIDEDIKKFDSLLEAQLKALKNNYEKAVTSLRSVEKEAIFDTRYGIYNKKYLLETIEKEIEGIKNHNHHGSLMIIKIKDSLLSKIVNNRDRIALTKNIAKLLQKTSKRSDIIAHFGDGVFAMLMKHTDIDSAKHACERISSLIYGSSFFIGEMDIAIDMEIAVAAISGRKNVEENIASILKELPNSSRNTDQFVIAKSD